MYFFIIVILYNIILHLNSQLKTKGIIYDLLHLINKLLIQILIFNMKKNNLYIETKLLNQKKEFLFKIYKNIQKSRLP